MPQEQGEIYRIADELRAIAGMGSHYATNEYDTERYQRILAISLRLVAALEYRPFEELEREYQEDNWRHISPAAGAEAVVYRQGKVLLIRRRDNDLWAVPGGLVEVGETLAAGAERELWEEASVRGKTIRLLGIFDSRQWQAATKRQFYATVFEVDAGQDIPQPGPEATEVGFFAEEELPALSPGHHLRVPLLFRLLRGELPAPYFDKTT